jgi:late competence protein required for DNA uptake (superfamily II DNA/RNA helicase)
MGEVICQRCGTTNEFYVVPSGPHLKALCNHCNNYIKFISQEKEPPKFYFGKYVGKYVHEIEDLSYLNWASNNMTLKQPMRDAIIKRISSLENLAR